jgi:hypothetical protein
MRQLSSRIRDMVQHHTGVYHPVQSINPLSNGVAVDGFVGHYRFGFSYSFIEQAISDVCCCLLSASSLLSSHVYIFSNALFIAWLSLELDFRISGSIGMLGSVSIAVRIEL